MKKKETLNFRVSAEFKRKLIEEAKKERRSLTNYLETTLTKLWDQQESATGKKGEAKKGEAKKGEAKKGEAKKGSSSKD